MPHAISTSPFFNTIDTSFSTFNFTQNTATALRNIEEFLTRDFSRILNRDANRRYIRMIIQNYLCIFSKNTSFEKTDFDLENLNRLEAAIKEPDIEESILLNCATALRRSSAILSERLQLQIDVIAELHCLLCP